jgi:hypothetical protein
MRDGGASFRGIRHVGYTEIMDPGASGEAYSFRIGTHTCLKAEKDS